MPAAADGSNVPDSSMEHIGTSDIGTFPIACTLEKHARGFYSLSGVCRVCCKTFRAAGGMYRGKPWSNHSRAQQDIIKHARTHGAVGYTPQRNLHKMRLDWVRSPDEPSSLLDGLSPAEDISKLEPSMFRAATESPQHVPGISDDVEAAQITTQSAAAGGSSVRNSSMEHKEAYDIKTFPIACTLKKDARGAYILSGVCRLCPKTYRCTSGVHKGKAQAFDNRDLHRITNHARQHGAVGYTPHRNLDDMRIDWVPEKTTAFCTGCAKWRWRTQFRRGASTCSTCLKLARAVQSPRGTPEGIDRKSTTTFCAGCAKWRRTTQFRRGASTCSTCLKIACAACGKNKKQTQYKTQDVYNFLNKKINALCRTCRRKGTKLGGAKHKTHKGEHCRECRCMKCGVYQALSAFRWTNGGRVDICGSCELVPCAACAAMLPRENFSESDIYRYFYFAGAKYITCLFCKEQQDTRQRRLQILMETSKRAACTCKHPHAHTRNCPLHARYAGESPYPGCDVMSRADSDWLREQRKKNGWK